MTETQTAIATKDVRPCGLAVTAGSVLRRYELIALANAADRLEAEAQTWCEGFAVMRDGRWEWTKEYEWAQIRVIHLNAAASALRAMHKRHSSQNPELCRAPASAAAPGSPAFIRPSSVPSVVKNSGRFAAE